MIWIFLKISHCTTINKVCASGMKSVMMAAQAIELGHRSVMLAGGMESMSKSPHYIYLRKPTGFGDSQTIDSIKFDGKKGRMYKLLELESPQFVPNL